MDDLFKEELNWDCFKSPVHDVQSASHLPVGAVCHLQSPYSIPISPASVKIGDTYTFEHDEKLKCYQIASERFRKNVQNRSKKGVANIYDSGKFSNRSNLDIDIQGVLGEYAFQKLFHLPLKIFDTTCQNFITDTFDACFSNGMTCDIKTIIKPHLPLLLKQNKATNPPHLYGLVLYANFDSSAPSLESKMKDPLHKPILQFKGFITKEELIKPERLEQMFRNEWYYKAPQSILKNPSQIFKNSI